jgi:hypothetical protein
MTEMDERFYPIPLLGVIVGPGCNRIDNDATTRVQTCQVVWILTKFTNVDAHAGLGKSLATAMLLF